MKHAYVVALSAVWLLACSKQSHPATSLTVEQRSFVHSRPTPNEVPDMPGTTDIGARAHIAAPPQQVWEIIALDFGKIADWGGAGVAESSAQGSGLGATRHCKIAAHMPMLGGATYDEEIIAWDPTRRYFAFVQTQASGPTDQLVGESWVDSDGKGGTVITTTAHFRMTFPMSLMSGSAASKIKRQFVYGLAGLKHFAETGQRVTGENWETVAKQYPRLMAENNL